MRQRGSLLIYGVVALLLVTTAGGAVWSYNRAIARAETAETKAAQLKTAYLGQLGENDRLRASEKALQKQLVARRVKEQEADAAERKRDESLKQAFTEPAVRAWGDTLVPAAVLASVRDDERATATKDGAGSPARGVAPNDTAASLAGVDDKRGAARLRPPASATAESVQQR